MLLSVFRLRNYDVIHINQAFFFPLVSFTKVVWRVPYVYTTAFNPIDEVKHNRFLKKYLLKLECRCIRFASRWSDKHLAVSNYCSQTMQREMGVLPDAVIYHGIETGQFAYRGDGRSG